MKKGFGKKIIFLGVGLIFLTSNVNAANSCSGCGSYSYVEQSATTGTIGFCIDSGAPGGLKAASKLVTPERLSGSILNGWAQMFNTAKKQQIAYRLIAIENGLSKDTAQNRCIKNGCYTNDQDFNEVYTSWLQQSNKSINRTASAATIELQNLKKDSNSKTFTAIIINNGSTKVKLSTDNSSVNIANKTLKAGESTIVSGPIDDECTGATAVIKATSTTTSSNSDPGTGCKNTSGSVEMYYYPGQNGTQGFIVPVDDNQEIPGKCKGGTSGSSTSSTSKSETSIEIDLDPDECNNCGADISEKFWCEGGSEQSLQLYETNNILGCVVSGKYDEYCNSSIKKTTDIEKTVDTIAGISKKTNLKQATTNKYCSVYCIEHIDYDLPGKIEAKNGSYFKLSDGTNSTSIKLTGTRTCYTSKINNKKYASDMADKQSAIIKEYNEYLRQKAIYEFYSNPSNFNDFPTYCTSYSSYAENDKKQCVLSGASTTTYHHYAGIVTYKQYYCTFDPETGAVKCEDITDSEVLSYDDVSSGGGSTTSSCGTYTSSCPTVTKTADDVRKEKMEVFENYSDYKYSANVLSQELSTIIANYKSCYNWTNNYCFNPKIKFTYEDGKTYKINENNYLTGTTDEAFDNKTGDVTSIGATETLYYSSVNNEYEGDRRTRPSESTIKYFYVEDDTIYKNADVDTTTHYVSSSVQKVSEFTRSSIQICSYHPEGTILVGDECKPDGKNTLLLDESEQGYVFPVSLEKKENRQYNYYLEFENIGVDGEDASCDSAQTNRLMGCSNRNDVYTETTQKEDKYLCQYGSCPKCNVKCVCPDNSPNCYVDEEGICRYVDPDPDCPTCIPVCIGCVWNDGDATFAYKQVSVSDLFPNSSNNTDVGYNWNVDAAINKDNADKAEATIKEIENEAENVYSEPEYSYTLTPTTMAKIRAYNAEANKDYSSKTWGTQEGGRDNSIPNGGYSNATLTCTNGEKCTSSFLDGLVTEAGWSKNEFKRSTDWKVFNESTKKWETTK